MLFYPQKSPVSEKCPYKNNKSLEVATLRLRENAAPSKAERSPTRRRGAELQGKASGKVLGDLALSDLSCQPVRYPFSRSASGVGCSKTKTRDCPRASASPVLSRLRSWLVRRSKHGVGKWHNARILRGLPWRAGVVGCDTRATQGQTKTDIDSLMATFRGHLRKRKASVI